MSRTQYFVLQAIGPILLVMGISMSIAIPFIAEEKQRIATHGVAVKARVLAARDAVGFRGAKKQMLELSFSDQDGKTIQVKTQVPDDVHAKAVKDKTIKIKYDPADPEKLEFVDFAYDADSRYVAAAILILLGAAGTASAIFLLRLPPKPTPWPSDDEVEAALTQRKLVIVPLPGLDYLVALFSSELWILSGFILQVKPAKLKEQIEQGEADLGPIEDKTRIRYRDIAEIEEVVTANRLNLILKNGGKHELHLTTPELLAKVRGGLLRAVGRPHKVEKQRMSIPRMMTPPLVGLIIVAAFSAIAAFESDWGRSRGGSALLARIIAGSMVYTLGVPGTLIVAAIVAGLLVWWMIHRVQHPHIVNLYRLSKTSAVEEPFEEET